MSSPKSLLKLNCVYILWYNHSIQNSYEKSLKNVSYQKHLKYQRYLINSTLTGLTLEPSETSKIAPKPLQGLQGRSQWPPRTPPGSKGHPRDPKRAPRDFRRASFRVLAGAETTIEPEHFVRNRRRSKHLNISLVLRTHQTQFWPGGMRAAFK